jgi:hypothetical protein
MIVDTCPCATQGFYLLSDETARIYQICESADSFNSIIAKLPENATKVNENKVNDQLCDLVNKRLLLEDHGMFLSLAVSIDE